MQVWRLLQERVTKLIPERQRELGRIGKRKRIPASVSKSGASWSLRSRVLAQETELGTLNEETGEHPRESAWEEKIWYGEGPGERHM